MSEDHEPAVWGPAEEAEQTQSGRMVRAGWVWTCGCGEGGDGYATEEQADEEALVHVWRMRIEAELAQP